MSVLKKKDVIPVGLFCLCCISVYFSDFSLMIKIVFSVLIASMALHIKIDSIESIPKLSVQATERIKIGLTIILIASGGATLVLMILDSLWFTGGVK